MADWFTTSWGNIGGVAISAVAVYALVLLYTRIVGLRSFAKMSSFDFAMTVAVGSSVASAILTKAPSIPEAAVALGAIYGLQWTIGVLRLRFTSVQNAVDNEPLLLMDGQNILHDNLRRVSVTEDDLWAKLREANVLDLSTVRAVVMETTGDISVLAGSSEVQPEMLRGVRGADAATPGDVDLRPSTPATV